MWKDSTSYNLFRKLLINSMEKLMVTNLVKKFLRLLYNPKIHYRVHKSLSLVPILNQMHQVHTFPTNFPKIHSNIILPSTPRSSEWPIPFKFSEKNFVRTSHLLSSRLNSLVSYHNTPRRTRIFTAVKTSNLVHDFCTTVYP